jgi:glycosyltransferase involved in cell wall biosynthesis
MNKYRLAAAPLATLDRLGLAPRPPQPVSYVVEAANWSTRWDGLLVRRGVEAIAPGTARIVERPALTAHSLVHFFSHYQWLTWGPWLAASNRYAVTFYHGKPEDDDETAQQIEGFLKTTPRVDKVVTAARLVAERLVAWGVPESKIALIPIPIDLAVFKPPVPEARSAARRRLGIPDGAIAVGCFQKDGVGWRDGNEPKLIKGPDILVETVRRAARQLPIFVVLTGPARGYVKAALQKHGIPFAHNFVSDYEQLPEIYAALDVYLNPSREEGGPKGILEAMAMGIPVVSTRVGMAPDIIVHGVNGYLAETGDSETLADGITALAPETIDREALRQAGFAAVQPCSIDAVGEAHWRLIVEPYLQNRG